MDKMLDGNSAAESVHAAAVDGAEATYARYEDRARNRVIEKLLGHDSRKSVQKHECGVFYLAEYMLDDSATYGFDADGLSVYCSEELANAVAAASTDWEWLLEKRPDSEATRKPEDAAHYFIWKQARKALEKILESERGQGWIQDEVQSLAEDDDNV